MTEQQVIQRVKKEIERVGSLRGLAREWGVTPSYLCDIVNGRRAPGPKILTPLGLRWVKTVSYVAR